MNRYYNKYPKILNMPWSHEKSETTFSPVYFWGREVSVTLKMDGETTIMTKERVYQGDLRFRDHPSRYYVSELWGSMRWHIPDGWKFCGENVLIKRRIFHKDIESGFLVFNIFDENNNCLSWDDTVIYSAALGFNTVPELYRGLYRENVIKELLPRGYIGDYFQEGCIIRVADEFNYQFFNRSVAKVISPGFNNVTEDWWGDYPVRNRLKEKAECLT